MAERQPPGNVEIGTRLRQRREHLRLTQGELSIRAGIGISSLSEFENGKREPTLSQLKKLAGSLAIDLCDLLSPGQPSVARVRWRERPVDADVVEARFLRLCRQYRDLERWAGEEEPMVLRRPVRCPVTRKDVEALADQVRAELQLGERPGLGLLQKLEDDYGLRAFHLRVEPSGTAACTGDPEYGPAVLLNSLNSGARRALDLAHELFHLLLWGTSRLTPEDEESLAGSFAATLLLPEGPLRHAVSRRIKENRLSPASLCELARDFGVSVDALLWRMHNVYGWQDADRTRELAATVRGYRDFTTDKEEEFDELPVRYRSLAFQLLRSGEISVGRFAEYMGLRRWQAMKYAQEAPGDEAVPLPPL